MSPVCSIGPILLLLERAVHQSSFHQPKNETDDRVKEELVEVDPKSRREHRLAILQRQIQIQTNKTLRGQWPELARTRSSRPGCTRLFLLPARIFFAI
jgi:hypothetical protein